MLLISNYIFCIPVHFPNCCKTKLLGIINFTLYTISLVTIQPAALLSRALLTVPHHSNPVFSKLKLPLRLSDIALNKTWKKYPLSQAWNSNRFVVAKFLAQKLPLPGDFPANKTRLPQGWGRAFHAFAQVHCTELSPRLPLTYTLSISARVLYRVEPAGCKSKCIFTHTRAFPWVEPTGCISARARALLRRITDKQAHAHCSALTHINSRIRIALHICSRMHFTSHRAHALQKNSHIRIAPH